VGSGTTVTSSLTDARLTINLELDRCLIFEDFDRIRLKQAEKDWDECVSRMLKTFGFVSQAGLNADLRSKIQKLWVADSAESLRDVLQPMLMLLSQKRKRGEKILVSRTRAITPIVLLAKHGLLAFPSGWIFTGDHGFFSRVLPDVQSLSHEPWTAIIAAVLPHLDDGYSTASLFRLMLTVRGIQEIGDIDATLLKVLRPFARREQARMVARRREEVPTDEKNTEVQTTSAARAIVGRTSNGRMPSALVAVVDGLYRAHLERYKEIPSKLSCVPSASYRETVLPLNPGRDDALFQWARADPLEPTDGFRDDESFDVPASPRFDQALILRLNLWAEACKDFVASMRGLVHIGRHVYAMNAILDFVIANPEVPSNPRDFLREDCHIALNLLPSESSKALSAESLRLRLGVYHQFFVWAMMRFASDNNGYPLPGYRLPVTEDDVPKTSLRHQGQTYRAAIPLRFLRLMREVLEECDHAGVPSYAWAKTLKDDEFWWGNPETRVRERIWSPLRATYFLIRLTVPLRGWQVRMLDSGEGDEAVFQGVDVPHEWCANTSRFAKPGHHRGFIRRMFDASSDTHINGMFINTNKTQDRGRSTAERGYEIPWQDVGVLRLFTQLRNFQEKYNPLLRPLTFAQIHTTGRTATEDVVRRMEPIHFLLRDPCSSRYPQDPIADSRLRAMWILLCSEVERRLDERNIRADDGQSIRLIERSDGTGRPAKPIFDMHALRVSGLTHFVAADVPIQILSAMVAGHATTLMTYYYVRPTPSQVDEILRRAKISLAKEETEARDLAAWAKNQPLKALEEVFSTNDDAGLDQLQISPAGMWGTSDYGVCPNGSTMCSEGGPLISDTGKVKTYLPVIGGPQNCACCRFFITGPPWLGGLAAKFNATMGQFYEAFVDLKALEARHRVALGEVPIKDGYDARLWHDRGVRKIDNAIEAKETEIAILAETMERLREHIRRSRAIAKDRDKDDAVGVALVLSGCVEELEISLQSTTEHDLWYRILEGADVYPGIDGKLPALRLSRMYDAMLIRDDLPSCFIGLSDAELQRSVLELGRFLRAKLGDETSNELAEGTKLLSEVGFLDAVAIFVKETPVRLNGLLPTQQSLVPLRRRGLLS
jgi:hypothetical protein